MADYTIGQIARRASVAASAIRYYEHEGLLPPPPRRGGRRVYGAEVLKQLAGIELAKTAGFSIKEIRQFIAGTADTTAASARWHALARTKIAEIERSIARQQSMVRLLREGLACGCLELDDCALVADRLAGRRA